MKDLNLVKTNLLYTQRKDKTIDFDIDSNFKGTLSLNDLIVYKGDDDTKIYNRICDHAGGRLITSNDGKVTCTLHKWEFNPEVGTYNSNNVRKAELDYKKDKNSYKVNLTERAIQLPDFKTDKEIEIKFLNHASLLVTTSDFKFATDPWLTGQAFSTGWWLKYKTPDNWQEELNSCDFLYISHTHPDHLHPETLESVDRKMPILISDFDSQSSENYLKSLGFKNLIKLKYQESLINQKKEIFFTVLKSGDFRDDSGLLFQYGNFSALFNVDSNYLNFFELPETLTLVASSFAGGAGPYPVCFENLSEKQKSIGQLKTNNSLKVVRESLIARTNPKYFIPYAGFFDEKSSRDHYIKQRNKKNSFSDYLYLEPKYNLELIDVTNENKHMFQGSRLMESSLIDNKIIELNEEDTEEIISNFKKYNSSIDDDFIVQYFKASQFYENLNLLILLTDDKFEKKYKSILVEFSKNNDPQVILNYKEEDVTNIYNSNIKNTIKLKIRNEVFINIIKNLEPWENMTIGFQAKFDRFPDIYNSKFWHHFTDKYTKFKAVRLAAECGGCELISQSLVSSTK